MEIIKTNSIFKILFNKGKTYMVVDNNGDCWKSFTSEKKAINYFTKTSAMCGAID